MKIWVGSLIIFLGIVLSSCGKTTEELIKSSSKSSGQKIEKAETPTQSESAKTPEVLTASDNIRGVWKATGKEDRVSSTWYFNNGQLVVNNIYKFSYVIAEKKDSKGYTVVTITNKEGKKHALLLKKNGSNFDGITVESNAYDKYLTDETVQKGQFIEFIYQQKQQNVDSQKVSQEEMEHLKKTLRTYIFDEYMPGPDYVYARGINWSENFYDNLTAEEIWNVIVEFKKKNNGKEGSQMEQASYLSVHAPIKDNWKKLFLEDWNKDEGAEKITKLVDHGDSVGVYTESVPYTGAKDNYPYVTLFKRTGAWHG
ncbi:hypothetical protein CN692_07670 [Bacillus sp. AFS002410]|uniref:hypothetical protein n=1 Tax=Bacillus sp. AFS002410 TaxID=2033481 RepID=UPI000BF08D89|nr:hypothetical protein [Bacillus sp. AFS002410]PEJ58846.1 hypothetical protein CN692_07670 [Bacillus sp. AFS002410]